MVERKTEGIKLRGLESDSISPGDEQYSMAFQYARLSFSDAQLYWGMTYPLYGPRLQLLRNGDQAPIVAIGANEQGKPVGLALAELLKGGETAELLSVYTHAAYRRRGIATAMLGLLEEWLAQRGCRGLRAIFERGRPMTNAIQGLLRKCQFPSVRKRALIGRCSKAGIEKAPWLDKYLLPSAFDLFLWKDLSEEEKGALKERQKIESWFPEQLNPFQDEAFVEPLNSLGLRYKGEIVGWMITHRTARDTIRYTAVFIREDLQGFGLAIPLLIESIKRQVGSDKDPVEKATFIVFTEMQGMVQFVRRYMAPYIDELNDSVETTRILCRS